MGNVTMSIIAIISTLFFIVLAGQLAVLRVQRSPSGKIDGTLTLTLLGLIKLVEHQVTDLTSAKVVLDPSNEKACDVELEMPEKTYRMQNVYYGKKAQNEKIVSRIQGFIANPEGQLTLTNPLLFQFILRLSIPVLLFIASVAWLIVSL